jgi:photosystem II stability/assembly factor-like uncharacterized protein
MPLRRFALAPLALLALATLACHEVHFDPEAVSSEIEIYDDLFSVSVVDDQHVVASGYWGAIYRSDDGGKTWSKADTGTKQLVYDVAMADELRGWAVGQLGMILRTEDGGKTWTRQPNNKVDQGVHLFSVQALDARRAWTVGEWGTRLYTDDGGQTWQDRSLTIDETHPQFVWLSISDQERVREGKPVFEDVTLNDVYCLPQDTDLCWLIGEFGYVFHTEDGGANWERGEILSGIQIEPMVFPYDQFEFTEEQRETVTEFAQSIADQQHLNVAIEPRVSEKELEELYDGEDPFPVFDLIEARTQSVVAAVEEAGILQDRMRRRGAPPWDYEDFLEDDPEFLKRYLDERVAEKPQVEVSIAQNPYLFTIRFADEMHGYISGLGGVVLRTQDGGRIWRYEDIGQKRALFSVAPFPDRRAIVVGEKGLMRVSDDAGESWHAPENFPTIFTFMRDINFEPGRIVGYIVGQRGMVLRTEDAGRTWRQMLPAQGEGGRTGPEDLAAN